LITLAIGLIQARLRVDKEWAGGFQGAIEIPIKTHVNNGWRLEMRFDRSATVDVRIKNISSFNSFFSKNSYFRHG
jgi:hypothetical protein